MARIIDPGHSARKGIKMIGQGSDVTRNVFVTLIVMLLILIAVVIAIG